MIEVALVPRLKLHTPILSMVNVKSKIEELDPQLLLSLERHAVSLAKESGELLIQYFQSDLEVTYKNHGEKNPVSNADLAAESFAMGILKGEQLT